jgi:hypothetical protein
MKSPLTRIQDAQPDTQSSSDRGPLQVEHAIEEEPTEIYIKDEITFDIPYAIQVLHHIVQALQNVAPTTISPHQLTSQVSTLEDLPRGLAILKECVVAWTAKVEKQLNTYEMSKEDLELQLKMTVAHSEQREEELVLSVRELEDKLSACKSENKKAAIELRSLCEEHETLERTIASQAENIESLEASSEELQERLVALSSSVEDVLEEVVQYCNVDGEVSPQWSRLESEGDGEGEGDPRGQRNLLKGTIEDKLEQVRTCCNKLSRRLLSADQEKEELKRTLESTVNQLTQTASPRSVEGETGSMFDEMLSTAEGKVEELESQQDVLKDQIEGLKETLRTKESELSSLQEERLHNQAPSKSRRRKVEKSQSFSSEVDRLKGELAQQQELQEETERRKHEVEEKLHLREEEVEGLREKYERSQSELHSLQDMVEQESSSFKFEMSSLIMEKEQAVKSYKKVKEELEQHKSILKERGSVNDKMKSLQREMESYQEEARQLQEQLMEVTALRDQERGELLKLKTHMDTTKEYSDVERDDMSRRLVKFTKENEELRKAVAGLLRQKASLWLHASDLEDKAQSTWQDSTQVSNCMLCKETFSFLVRKHHCRLCGKVFCWKCCSNWVVSTSSSGKVRSCNTCCTQREVSVAAKITNDLEQARKLAMDISPVTEDFDDWPDAGSLYGSYKIPPPTAENRSLQNGEYSIVPIMDGEAGDGLPFVLHTEYEDDGVGMQSESYCVIENSGKHTGECASGDSEGGGSHEDRDGDEEGDDRSLGEGHELELNDPQTPCSLDLDVLREKLALLEAQDRKGEKRQEVESVKPHSVGNPSTVEEKEVSLSAGQSHEVQLTIDKSGYTIEWEFRSEPKGIAFGIYYQSSSKSKTRLEVLPQRRCTSHKTSLTGKIVAQKSGLYTMSFDNGFSKYSGCRLFYKVQTRNA